ncbi:MAG: sulfurtransferase complex subunit TusB [Arenicellales bacterium]
MLHTVNKSPYSSDSLKTCAGYLRAGDALIFIEDGVYGAMKGGASDALVSGMGDTKIYALGPDLKARGIGGDKLIDGVEVVGFDGFVELVAASDKVQNWL